LIEKHIRQADKQVNATTVFIQRLLVAQAYAVGLPVIEFGVLEAKCLASWCRVSIYLAWTVGGDEACGEALGKCDVCLGAS